MSLAELERPDRTTGRAEGENVARNTPPARADRRQPANRWWGRAAGDAALLAAAFIGSGAVVIVAVAIVVRLV